MIENIKQKILNIYNKIIRYLKQLISIPIINIPSTLLNDFLSLFNNITLLLIQLLDYIVNEKESFMLRSAILLLVILGSIFYLFTFFNIGNLKKRENNNLVSIIFIGLFVCTYMHLNNLLFSVLIAIGILIILHQSKILCVMNDLLYKKQKKS